MWASLRDRPDVNLNALRRAYRIACEVHRDQKRCSGDAYISHPVAVAACLAQVGANQALLCAALLHDTLEDALELDVLRQRIRTRCGRDVLFLVEAMTKDPGMPDPSARIEAFRVSFEHAAQDDFRLALLKLSGLLHNLATIAYLPDERRTVWLRELANDYFSALVRLFASVPLNQRKVYLRFYDQLHKLLTSLLHE